MATASDSPRIFMDPVHGSIELEPYLVAIIDTPQFQRLRKIKQLGGNCYVYPGATHTRFEHSIGVCHIANELIMKLNKDTTWINEKEKACIKIAALCHDLGHGPYSHVYDFAVQRKSKLKLDKRVDHEYRSAAIVGQLMHELRDEFKMKFQGHTIATMASDDSSYESCIKLIQKMITFSNDYKKNEIDKNPHNWNLVTDQGKDKSYLFEIVANGFTGIDVDKMDYFLRDSRSVGLSNTFDWRRYTLTAKIIPCPDGYTHICSRDKDAPALYELFHTRIVLHRTVYQHKTATLIQYMIQQAMIEASEVITHKDTGLNPLECWKSDKKEQVHESFLTLTDDTVEQLVMGDISESSHWHLDEDEKKRKLYLDTAKNWLYKIKKRQLHKFLGSSKLGKQAEEFRTKTGQMNIKSGDLIDEKAKFDYGKDNANPMELHYFYSKWDSYNPFRLSKEEVSVFLPENFKETKIFWYLDTEDKTVLAKLRKSLQKSDSISVDPPVRGIEGEDESHS